MTPRTLAVICIAGLMVSGCRTNKITPLKVNTGQHSPVRMHVYEAIDPIYANQVLLLPPLGIKDPDTARRLHLTLYGALQRRFTSPVKNVMADSAYAPYVQESNLLLNDGSLNIDEIAIIGDLMNTTYVICTYVREIQPYHPQRMDIQLMVVNTNTKKISAELSSVFDAQESDVYDYFMEYSKSHKADNERKEDLSGKIKSPKAFQAFIADMCSSVMAERLPF